MDFMRKALTLALTVALATSLASPLTVLAQSAFKTATPAGTLAGRSVDAMGRGVIGERVELLRGTMVINSATTNGLGEWSFRGVDSGEYIVRMNVRGRIAGVRVIVANGQSVAGTMIVVPAATASKQFGALANFLTLIPAAATATAQATASVTQDVNTANLSAATVQTILASLEPADRVAFANAVIAALNDNDSDVSDAAAPFANAVTQLNEIVASQGEVVPTFPPPTNVS
jgi:hypothetical protein